MKPLSRVLIGVILLVILASAPSIEGKITGKHNQASAGCTCHYNGGGITATHDFPSTYTAGQTYTINIGFTGGTSASVGGFSLQVDKGTFSNPGSLVQINGLSATHSSSGSVSWTLDWTAPTSGSGTMSMDLAVLQGNGNNANSGDVWSQASTTITELAPNTPPTVSSLSLSPNGDVGVNQSLTLSYTYADANGDPESGTEIRWFSDGVLATGFNDQLSVPDTATSVGENWTVTVTPNDGIDLGTTESCPDYANIIDIDTDGDGTFNLVDTDDDDDGVLDTADAFPLDATESLDTDGDGTGNNADTDDDGDGVLDAADEFPLDATESVDTDGDGTGNNADTDDDNDGVPDVSDDLPLDATESVDTDGDGTGNNADTDDDGDGVLDAADEFPLDATESVDTDGDGTGNNADTDDDEDGVLDTADDFPLDATESVDTDGDGTGNNADTDDDGDGVLDGADEFPLDATESVDTDGDGTGNNADTDDDDDGVADASDEFPLDA
ncbi:MAG: choice-of-anchor V domain-containing protein, partial [Candidatus Poseidoniales archaeon]